MARGTNVGAGGHSPSKMQPVDHYRKELGRHQSHEQKKQQKVIKQRQRRKVEKQSAAGGYGMYLVLSLVFILAACYAVIYVGLKYEDEYVKAAVLNVNAFIEDRVMPFVNGTVLPFVRQYTTLV